MGRRIERMGRRIERIEYSKKFLKSLGKLSEKIIDKVQERELIFRDNPFHFVLNTHKLSGKEKDAWAFWINYSYRVKFIFLSDKEVLFLDIGTHDIYK